MDSLATSTARLRRFGAQMNPDLPRVDVALPALRALLRAAGVPFKLIGGLAVVHHGYERLTVDVDVLVSEAQSDDLEALLAAHDFERVSRKRLRHRTTGVRVDLLSAGDCLHGPRAAPPLPDPRDVPGSASDAEVVALPTLLELKLDAGRRQDLTDVLQLLKRLEDHEYLPVEAAVRRERRPELAALRDEALDELRWEAANET